MEVQFRFKVYRILRIELFTNNGIILWVSNTYELAFEVKAYRISWNLLFMKNGIHSEYKINYYIFMFKIVFK